MSDESAEFRAELAKVAREMLAAGAGWKAMADAGWLGLEVSERLGGSGAGFAEVAVVVEELGRAAATVPYLGTAVLGVGACNLVEADEAQPLLAAAASGEVRLAVALPPGDAMTVPFRIEAAGGRMVLEGAAELVPDAGTAEQLLLLALAPGGEPVIVSLLGGQPGLRVEERTLVDATHHVAAVTADAIAVSAGAVWHFRADPERSVRALLDRGALAVAGDCLGVAEAMLDATVAYAGLRHQFGRAIGSFQAVKHACADMLVQITIGRELVAAAVAAVEAQDAEAWVAVSMAKSFLGTMAVEVAGKAMQLHGGFGYTWESGVHAYLKRAVLNRGLFGSPAAHRARLAVRYATTVR